MVVADRIKRMAIGDMIRRAALRYPNKTAVVDGEQRVSYQEFDEACNRFANYLLGQGLRKGDRVACICQNSVEFLVSMFGIAKAGLVWVPMNPMLAPQVIEYIILHSEARAIVTDSVFYPKIAPLLRALPDVEKVVTLPVGGDASIPGTTPFPEAVAPCSALEPEVHIRSEDLAIIMYTSGTTGNPKGVMHSHMSIYVSTLGNIIECELAKDDVVACLMPLFHCAQHILAASTLHLGATVVVMRGFEPNRFLGAIAEEKISWTFMLPMMYRAMLDCPERENYDLSSLRNCMYAMAPMGEGTIRQAIHEFKARFSLGSGQTEMYPATMIFKPEEQLRRFGSYWGVSSLLVETAIMDDDGNLLPPGEAGEIVHRGPNAMEGYWRNEEETAKSRKFGWHHTGDLGVFDPDGQMIFVDRKKDMIKTGGENVPSIKVESVILNEPRIANATVLGLPHERWIEAVTAFVKLKPGVVMAKEELIDYCKKHLSGFEVPKAVVILEEFPVTATGKIQKNVLRQQYIDYYANSER